MYSVLSQNGILLLLELLLNIESSLDFNSIIAARDVLAGFVTESGIIDNSKGLRGVSVFFAVF